MDWPAWLGLISAILGIVTFMVSVWSRLQKTIKRNRFVEEEIGHYLIEDIEQASNNYIKPHCQINNPAHRPDDEKAVLTGRAATDERRQDLFKTIDQMLDSPGNDKYILLLGETGTGKSSFLLNYYARHLDRKSKGYQLRVVPVNISETEIQKSRTREDKAKTVLFLDALDEDREAIKNHRKRVSNLCKMTEGFRTVLITCRTQFFPRQEEEPGPTEISKIGAIKLGEDGEYIFQKRYLSPFNDRQVNKFLRRKYGLFHWPQYRSAKKLIEQYRELMARPMILQNIEDLFEGERTFKYSHELYEEIVKAWLKREVGRGLVNREDSLRDFSKTLAVELMQRSQQEGANYAEELSYEEVIPFAKELNLDTWKAISRSLLIRTGDRFRFAHRSIMEYLFVKHFITLKPEERPEMFWSNQMGRFLSEMAKDNSCRKAARSKGVTLVKSGVKIMLAEQDFYDSYESKYGQGIEHFYVCYGLEEDSLIVDLATGLTWQRSGSENKMPYKKEISQYIRELNTRKLGGYSDWRLPTLEEAMSLMEPKKNDAGLHIASIFNKKQSQIVTADRNYDSWLSFSWYVSFDRGFCSDHGISFSTAPGDYGDYVRAVR